MENSVDIKFDNSKFIIKLETGKTKVATPITRLKIEGTDAEYLYYSIEDDDDNDKVAILASRIVTKEADGKIIETLKDLQNEEERQIVFQIFSEAYKILKSDSDKK